MAGREGGERPSRKQQAESAVLAPSGCGVHAIVGPRAELGSPSRRRRSGTWVVGAQVGGPQKRWHTSSGLAMGGGSSQDEGEATGGFEGVVFVLPEAAHTPSPTRDWQRASAEAEAGLGPRHQRRRTCLPWPAPSCLQAVATAVAGNDVGVVGGHVSPLTAGLHAGAGPEAGWVAGTEYTVVPGPVQDGRPSLSHMAESRFVP